MPAKNRQHYAGTYQRRARQVREVAYADPLTRCWRCGGLLYAHRPDDKWHAGHVVDGAPDSPLAPEHASCNTKAGARRGYLRGRGDRGPSVDWL